MVSFFLRGLKGLCGVRQGSSSLGGRDFCERLRFLFGCQKMYGRPTLFSFLVLGFIGLLTCKAEERFNER